MGPLLVEYSGDEDTGCGIGAIVMIGLVTICVLLLRLAMAAKPRS